MIITLRRIYNSNMAANESVFLRSIRDVVGEVLRDLRASVSKRAFIALTGCQMVIVADLATGL